MYVKAKKYLGQHFLKDEGIAQRIVDSLILPHSYRDVLEVGPGMGVLTKYLLKRDDISLKLVELDSESVVFLREHYPEVAPNLLEDDFLQMKLEKFFHSDFAIIGNFPYNISSQIFFKVIEYRDQIPQVVGMVQKEVAERLASPPGKKAYGILSVLLQAWYDIEYLFTVEPGVFAPPPKVKSAVIRIKRNSRTTLNCDPIVFKNVVKCCFNQRRKTIRNSIKPLLCGKEMTASPLLDLRPEQLSIEQFEELSRLTDSLNRV
jgi:16S rRNA (adenine1518-N6/adenine1519-N6)-dimethyltransferase